MNKEQVISKINGFKSLRDQIKSKNSEFDTITFEVKDIPLEVFAELETELEKEGSLWDGGDGRKKYGLNACGAFADITVWLFSEQFEIEMNIIKK